MAFDHNSRHPKLPGRMNLLSAIAEESGCKKGSQICLDIRQPNGSSVEDTNWHGHCIAGVGRSLA